MRSNNAPNPSTPRAMPAAAWIGLFTVAAFWGGSFVAIRVAVQEVPVLSLVALRVLGASLVLLVFLRLSGLRFPRGAKVWSALLVQSFVGYTVPFFLIGWGQKYLTSGLASILNASTAVFGVLIAAMVLKDERLSRQRGIGVTLGFAGVAVAMGLETLATLDLTSLAQLALLAASLSYAISNAWNRAKLRETDPRLVAGITLSLASAQLVPLALLHDGLPTVVWSLPAVASIAYLSVVSTALAYMVYYRVLALAGAGNASLVTLLVAPIAIVLGAVILGEQLALNDYLGFALLALGLLIIDGRLRLGR